MDRFDISFTCSSVERVREIRVGDQVLHRERERAHICTRVSRSSKRRAHSLLCAAPLYLRCAVTHECNLQVYVATDVDVVILQ